MKTITISCSKAREPSREVKRRILGSHAPRVAAQFDRAGIALLATVMERSTGERCVFACSGKVDYDMFGACDYAWELRSDGCSIARRLSRDICESLQRVEEAENATCVTGFERIALTWNGDCGSHMSPLRISFRSRDTEFVDAVLEACRTFYDDVEVKHGP